ncbi:MAG: IS1380 family transposase [Actinomycetes bacterium]
MNGNRRSRRVQVVAGSESLISSAGGSLLVETAAVAGLDRALCTQLAPWRAGRARHDPGKVVLDVAVAIALGGDCLADLAVVRAQPELFGPVASDPTVSRLIAALAQDAPAALEALRAARARARARVWSLDAPVAEAGPIIIDLDATIVLAHSEKEGATATWKRTFGFHPLLAFLDHGAAGTGEPVAGMLRTGKASANDAADHIAVLTDALAQLPEQQRSRVLVRGDSGAGVHAFIRHIHDLGLGYSVGIAAHQPVIDALEALPRQAWRAARDTDGAPRDGAQVAELTRYLSPPTRPWPPGMRVIARRERPHPGAQLRLTDADGWRITVFATNTRGGRIADLEMRHRLRARAEDRIRCLKDTGLRNLPLHDFAANQIWLELVSLAADLLAWTQHLALAGTPARTWEPKRLRLRLLNIAGRIVRTGRRHLLRLPRGWPWADPLLAGHHRLAALTT